MQWELEQLRLLREISMAAPGPPTQAALLLYSSYTLMLWSSRIAAAAVVSFKAVLGRTAHVQFHLRPDKLGRGGRGLRLGRF